MIFFLKFNQVIYSSSPISWPSFKSLAQILFKISCWQDFILIFSKGHNSRREITRTRKKKYGSAIYPWGIHIWNFKTLACTVHKIWLCIQIFSKGHNSRKGDNLDKKKMCCKYFSMRNPYMKFENSSMHGSWTDGHMDARPETNMPCQLLWSWGHNYLFSTIDEKVTVVGSVVAVSEISAVWHAPPLDKNHLWHAGCSFEFIFSLKLSQC